nr:PBP1A family penicillin-binding protein [uncultured Sphingomonas sp.]
MTEGHGIWQRGGVDVEQLPDPFAPPAPAPQSDTVAPRPRRRWLRWGLTGFFALILATLLWLIFTAPLSRALEPLENPAMLILSEEGRPIARRGAVKDEPVEIVKLDPMTPNAFIAIEDRRFRSHWGIDPRSIGRAMVANFRAGGVREGGSTITQQLAKTSFLSSDRSYKRKAQEVIIAFWLEGWLTKDEILQRYLSSVYFGDGVYGLRAASRHYFGREPEKLTLAQSAMLAGMVQAPSRLAPTRNLALAQKRSRLVLQEMADNGYITQARARATASARPTTVLNNVPTGTYFADWVAPQANASFDADYGEVKVTTTLDADLQRLAVRAVNGANLGDAQAALVAIRPDGRVVAMVGGRDYGKSPFNRATQSLRQPGSAFKLFVYLAAMRAGYRPDSIIDDKPITIDGWTPGNNDGVYRGPITLREAFLRSSNAATVRLAEQVGRQNVIRAARDLGVTTPIANQPSISLGTSGMNLLELTSAYAAIASGNYPVKSHGLPTPSKDGDANTLSTFFSRGGRLDDARDRAPMMELLWAAANEGTGRRAAITTATFGKTGTTQGNRDALFIGFAGNLVVGVWVGRDDNQSLGKVSGGTVPADIWRRFMGPAVAIDRQRGPQLPPQLHLPDRRRPDSGDKKSPIPDEWVKGGEIIRDIINFFEDVSEKK